VATLLGLLLVVTFIANLLTTVVPNEMQVNDLNHAVLVQNQFGRLASLLHSAGLYGSTGMQLIQPVSLGSQGVAPWAAQDGSTIGSAPYGSAISMNFSLLGATTYSPPTGSPQGGAGLPAACTWTSASHVGISCTGSVGVLGYNFSGNSKTFTFSDTGSSTFVSMNYSTNNSKIQLSLTGAVNFYVAVYGSNDVITTSGVGSGKFTVLVVGSNDFINLGSTGSAAVTIDVYGSSDTLYQSTVGSGNVDLTVFGSQDSFTLNSTGSGSDLAYVTGFNATNPSTYLCPNGNLSSTDTLAGSQTGSGTYTAYYNNTAYTGTKTVAPWKYHYQEPAPSNCPFFSRQQIALSSPAVVGTGPVLDLVNHYAPAGQVGYDQGAVVFAQYGAYPVFVDPPAINLVVNGGNVTAASIWLPFFSNLLGSVAGVGTETLDFHLLQSSIYTINASGGSEFAVNPNVPITINITTPFAAAWDLYLNADPDFSGLWSCAPVTVCTGVYSASSPLGTVSIVIPTSSLEVLRVGSSIFSASLT
jgi:hypothetical protein